LPSIFYLALGKEGFAECPKKTLGKASALGKETDSGSVRFFYADDRRSSRGKSVMDGRALIHA
jgi:hypothetical protein